MQPIKFLLFGLLSLGISKTASAETMTPNEQIIHITNRITYGANAETINHVKTVGVDKFIDEQLHPENIALPDDLANKLGNMETINMSLSDIIDKYGEPLIEARKMGKAGDKTGVQMARKESNIIVEELSQAKIERGVESNAQLQEVLTDFWYNHFNVFAEKDRDRFLREQL